MDYAEFFEEVINYREAGRCLHELSNILLLVLCGLLADCEMFEEIYDYARGKEAVLRVCLALPAGIPSHDTLNRVSAPEPRRTRTLPRRVGAAHRGPVGGSAPGH